MVATTARRARKVRHARVRRRIKGTAERPRLCVFRSLLHVQAQICDDTTGHVLAAASTMETAVQGEVKGKRKTEQSRVVGALVAHRALEKGVSLVVFDRGGYRYHGRVKAMAEAAREGGLKF
ncbi:MAG: 50S ribosomal protein L18 [Dehalococcoidia bacterium]|nr:50S ribosomal protein L18 [Dehalococcoidia bacterium]MDP6511444.1 50S ribosomal protein L18 [Dehalococcoidia bacterium]MDP6783187.1 50S ribosomal protein L18 [Dehalococcoidia bacterium]